MEYYYLEQEINSNDLEKFSYLPNKKIGVLLHLENGNNEILLQQKSSNCHNKQYLYENINGIIEDDNISFREAIIRECQKQIGNDIEIDFQRSIGIFHKKTDDTNWIFIVFKGKYLYGPFENIISNGIFKYKFFTYEEIMQSSMISENCRFITEHIYNKKSY